MSRYYWNRTIIETPGGLVEGVAPLIISASRATDIPAFYAEWMMRRLRAGYLVRANPFNGRRQYISLAAVRVIIFWSKHPAPLLPHLEEIEKRGLGYYFTCTVNDYEEEALEPGLPPMGERIDAFRSLSRRIGRERLIWRFDPVILGGGLTPRRLLNRIARLGEALHPFTRKLVVSFADLERYPRVRQNLVRSGHGDLRELSAAEVLEVARGLERLNRGWGLELATCAEEADLSAFGIAHNRCIDDALIARLYPEDKVIGEFLGRAQAGLASHPLKDRGQRRACGCIVSRDIGRYGSCPFGCVYCYANTSPDAARLLHAVHSPDAAELGKLGSE